MRLSTVFQASKCLLKTSEWENADDVRLLTSYRDIIAGLDVSQMDEETLWTETQKYYPYADREGELHLD